MKKSYLIIVGVVVAAGIGVGAYLLTKNNNTSNTSTNTSSTSAAQTANGFDPLNSADRPFVATIKTDLSTGVTNSTLQHDSSGIWYMTSTVNGQKVEAIYTKDAYYTKMNGQWYKSPTPVAFSKDAYDISPKELADFQAAVKDKGHVSCPAGTCELWEADNYKGSEKLSFYVDSSNKINQLVTVTNGKTITITYDYKPVTITVPTNIKNLPSLPSAAQTQQ